VPLFEIKQRKLKSVERTNFSLEKELQGLIEQNLDVVFNSRLVATEFSTGKAHAGRIDTLALSEENNPVIIEYKKVESSELITQSLYYLQWIHEHRGDFEIAAQKAVGTDVEIDWSDIRVICIAPNYKKYDLYAVQVMGANIELWTYRLFNNSTFYLEQMFNRICQPEPSVLEKDKSPKMIEAGKKAAITRATGAYTFEEHLEGIPENIKDLALEIQEFVLGLDSAIDENPKKLYIGYKTSKNIVCMIVQKSKIVLYLKLNPKEIKDMPSIARDATDIGHHATGEFELTVDSIDDLEIAKQYIEIAYKKAGG
jgi:predicted transport protein